MELQVAVEKDFLDLFYNDIKDITVDDSGNTLNLFTLKIENNKFAYTELLEALRNSVVTYALSRKEISDLGLKIGTIYKRAVDRLRKYESNDGELGELLLYSFLESHLNAPKIFTKLKLKTSSNDYVKGADGIHLLKLDSKNYQLIFGESKVYTSITGGISEAFKSINEFLNRDTNNIYDEINLLCTHLKEEVVDNSLYEFLKKIIIPSASQDDIYKDNAFGIFVGFNIEISNDLKKLPTAKYREAIRKMIKNEVEKQIEYIKNKIEEYELYGYSFYIYMLPFTKLDETRKRFIRELKEV
jgi:Domain of unknown function (DUF1837).